MKNLHHNSLNFNNKITYDFGGGNLSSDSGLLLVRSFLEKISLWKLFETSFDVCTGRKHSLSSVIEQLIYTNIAGYHQDDASDKLRHNPVPSSLLGKKALASQPTVSRALNSFSKTDITKFNDILMSLFKMLPLE